jgi:uncharacterized protein (TIGR03437 family)
VGNASWNPATPVIQAFTVAVGPLAIASVLNAGSYAATSIAPDVYAVIFGYNFSTTTALAKSLELPTALTGTTVTITDAKGVTETASLVFVSPTQVNFVAPEGLANGGGTVTVTNAAGSKASYAVPIAPVSPSLFTADSSGTGAPAGFALVYPADASPQSLPLFDCSGTPQVCTAVPIDLGPSSTSVYLELFGTGIRGRSGLSAVSVTLGGVALQVSYVGAQGTYAGLDQINALVDRSLIGGGVLTLQLVVNGAPANAVVVNIK